jgi:hypothetical protein
MRTSPLGRSLLVSALAFGACSSANAIPVLRLTTSAGATATVTDGGVGDANSQAGVVVFMNPLSDWFVNVTTGLSKPTLGSPSLPELDLNSVNVSSFAGGWLDIELTDTDFTPKVADIFLSAIGGTTSGSVSYKTYFDSSNAAFGKATELTSFAGGGPAFASSATSILSSATPYSLTLLVRVTHASLQASSFDATLKVPEPGTLLLLGAGFLALAVARRQRG